MDDIIEEINDLKGPMEKMMEMLQALSNREEPHMHIVIFKVTCISFEPQHPPRVKTSWPEFGLPPNYSQPFAEALGVGTSTQHVVQLQAVPEMIIITLTTMMVPIMMIRRKKES